MSKVSLVQKSISTKPKSEKKSLEQTITQMESNNSVFENSVRNLKLPANSVFTRFGKIGPAGFKPTSNSFNPKDIATIQAQLKNISSKENTVILEAVSSGKRVTGKNVAVLFSGGPAAGGHNVIVGIKKALGKNNKLFGIKAGPKGLLAGDMVEVTDDDVAKIKNTGGFDYLGSDRTKIKTKAQFEKVKQVVKEKKLDGIIVVGGDDSNTNAAFLADYLKDVKCSVIGVPKTIDGDLQVGSHLPITFGFDTATKIYAELVGNLLQDTPSSRKYWHFVKIMGRSASHVALEVALQTKPNITLISEEVQEKKITLNQIIDQMAKTVAYRAGKNINYGVAIIPEGIIEFIPDFKGLIQELNDVFAKNDLSKHQDIKARRELVYSKLTPQAKQLMESVPSEVENMLLLERDAHGNLQVARIPTELLFIKMVGARLKQMKANPENYFGKGKIDLSEKEIERFKKSAFPTINHFFGYEGRCGAPSRFDATYTYNLGLTAGSLICSGNTGYMAAISDLDKGGKPIALPLAGLLTQEVRHGKKNLVIEKALVKMDSPAFKYFVSRRNTWAKKNVFTSPGPRQLFGKEKQQLPLTVALNQKYSK